MKSRLIKELDFTTLRETNVRRCNSVFHRLETWSPSDWACALAGEAGEVCDAVKKLRRLDNGLNMDKDPQTYEEAIDAIAMELADTVIYADLLAARLSIDLGAAVMVKFNKVSALMNYSVML